MVFIFFIILTTLVTLFWVTAKLQGWRHQAALDLVFNARYGDKFYPMPERGPLFRLVTRDILNGPPRDLPW